MVATTAAVDVCTGGEVAEQDPSVLEYERDMNTAYLANLERRSGGYEIDDRTRWTPRITIGSLIGRVRMRYDGDDADEEFYVAETSADLDGVEVISWAAPAAAAYYGKRYGEESGLKIRRRFTKGPQHGIETYADEWIIAPDGAEFSTPSAGLTAREEPQAAQAELPRVVPGTEEQLRKPRTSLKALLRTLQPEQYDLVAASPTESLTIQGYAGTGKTVVATHRAAWLTHTDRETPLRRVALIGPTQTWARHISPVVDELATPGTVTITSLPEVMRTIIGAPERHASSDDFLDAYSAQLGKTLDRLVTKQRKADPALTPARAYEVFLHTNDLSIPASRRPEFLLWRETLPQTYENALGDRTLWPLLTYLTVLLSPQARYDHIIVDEAQDLRPLEWLILTHLNSGAWTLVGDTHQRRTSHTPRGWKEIRTLLGLSTWDEESLLGGYRTTKAIIDFAACLLEGSAGHRAYDVLGEGEPPLIIHARTVDELEAITLEQADRLSADHPKGKVAVITPLVRPVGSYAHRHGWTEGADHYWSNEDGRRFTLLTSEEARGLEFDAVVVVEPSAFKALPGDNGPLYTALTRANLELVIVHERVLPPKMVRHLRTHRPAVLA
ncbi:AAA family ATPase [Raineyella fluvialis]|uniref:AAA family ATPase n=1 Tax=Raineyella fluvialis TaxID=2662261 RepID=A0A5Q2F7Z5_9ACTN|nr:AAA family ATPase [Raineyella fluvialis]QGF23022.1 AAA family ATPase [Raineyella fluvialis]